MTSALFSPLTIRSVEFRNRLWVSPMCQYSCEAQDGVPGDWHLVELGAYAQGGAGLVMAEATGVVPEGRITPWCPGMWSDEQQAGWKRVVDFIHSQGAKAGIQLAHAGRKASTQRPWVGTGTVPKADGGWPTVAPSPIAFPGYDEPNGLSSDEINDIVYAFGQAAARALDAGFDVLEIHAAHGYLVHQFLSPLSNDREDEYGGSIVNRSRLLLDIAKEVRAIAGAEVPVLVRMSATDWMEPEGWTLEDTVTVAAWLREAGIDMIDVSTGGLVPGAKIPTGPGYQVPHSSAVYDRSGILTAAVGEIVDARQAEEIIATGKASAVLAAREFIRDPHFALRAAHELGAEVDYWPKQFLRGTFSSRPVSADLED
ncbi:NADH:flavin oxidoreductase/NADH oxidase [Demequina capsici]|uniref:NADH:flavin oxidoreductase/NADH oxidase n=1 Tax=Demequina capsici TaxID=3075620 RepID=A0AA96F8L9_9MICO|nr:NADH:flavin oxidoreductase/NADH oxidase [Demequina sp. OYTSA14]WNM25264.1 NADH:flavin oxidoreductase/NADH oxidase [Demequina sp. OYTSA14]